MGSARDFSRRWLSIYWRPFFLSRASKRVVFLNPEVVSAITGYKSCLPDIGSSLEFIQSRSRIANPAPLGLFAFASTTLVFSLYNVHALHVTVPNVGIGMAIFYGGLGQFIAGMWEFARGNTFCATTFTSYGTYWISFATIFIPGSGIGDAYKSDPVMLQHAMGLFHIAWMLLTWMFFIATLRKAVGLSVVFFSLGCTFTVLSIGFLSDNLNVLKIGGYFGIVTAGIAYYCGLAELLTPNDIITLPMGSRDT